MKKYLFFTILLAGTAAMLTGSFALLAQVPQSFKYQAVARDATGAMMANQELNFEISILKGDPSGEVVFAEQHTDTTNQFGLVTLDIGRGNVFTGDFSSITWGDDTYFLMVEMEGIYVGIMQLLSVPYALHAQTVSVDKVDDADADPLNEIQSLSLSGNDLSLSDGGGSVTLSVSSDGETNFWQQDGDSIYYNIGNVGIGTNSPAALLHTYGTGTGMGNILFEGEFKDSNPGDPPASGPGTRMMWYPDKAAFRAGRVGSTQLDKERIGDYSIATGYNTTASGKSSTAMGGESIALGNWSTATGANTYASGIISTAMGYSTHASGFNSTAMGHNTTAHSAYETVIGQFNTNYTPASTLQWDANDRLFVIGNGTDFNSESNAMTVLKNGNVGIGPDNPVYKLDLLGELNIQSEDLGDKAIFVNSTEALWYGGTYFSWGYGADYNYFARKVAIGTTTDPGTHLLVVNGTAAKPGGGSWDTWSDMRLKEIHEDYSKGLEEIADLRPVTFSYREDNPLMLPHDQEYVGLVAQDVQEVFPEAISEGEDGYLQLDLHPVNIALINAVRELKAENGHLIDANQQLRSENIQIIKRLEKLELLVLERANQ